MRALRKRGEELGVTGDELESGVPERAGSPYSGQGSVEDRQRTVSRETGLNNTGTSDDTSERSGGNTGLPTFDGNDYRSDGAGLS